MGGAVGDLDQLVAAARRMAGPDESALLLPRVSRPPAGEGGWKGHIARYLVSDEYAPQWSASRGVPYKPEAWAASLLQMCPREGLLRAITSGTRVAGAGGQPLEEWTDYVLSRVDPTLATHLRALLEDDDGGPTRVFLARQPLLLALKLVLGNLAPAKPGTADPFIVATLLSHHAAREPLRARHQLPESQRIGGFPAPLAMEIVANTIFNTPVEFGGLLARTRMLWTQYEHRLSRHHPRVALRRMLIDATGIDLDDVLAIAFALFAQAEPAAVAHVRELDLASLGLPQPTVNAFLDRFAVTEPQLAQLLSAHHGEWAFLPLEDRPLLRVGPTTVLVLDEILLQRRFTNALYWLVHDHERDRVGDDARRAWTQVYSELVELHAEDILARLAPVLLGAASSFFTEEQVGKLGDSAVDCGIDFGDFVLIADVVQHQMTVPTRTLCQVNAFEQDMQAMVLKKAKQLHGTARALLTKPDHPHNPLGRRPESLLPMVVQGADFPVNPVTVGYAREEARGRSLLTQDECRPLIIVTVDELETLDALTNTTGVSSREVFRAYAATGATNSLRNFIIDTYGGHALQRSAPIQTALDKVLAMIKSRLDP